MVIRITEGAGVLKIDTAHELGELVSAKSGALTPDRPKATPIRYPEPERSPGVMMPWARPLCATRNAVQYATRSAARR